MRPLKKMRPRLLAAALAVLLAGCGARGGQAGSAATQATPHPTAQAMVPQCQEFYRQNQDVVGRLHIPGTNIDYPVVQTVGDNEYYLRRGLDGEYAEGGTLFLDEHCATQPATANLMIYGHDMNDGSMFGQLELYAEKEYGEQHATLYFDTLYETGEYQLLAAFYSQLFYADEDVFKYYKFFDAATPQEFDDYVQNIKALAQYDTGLIAQYGDTLLTLSTCSGHTENGRFVVVAKRVE